MRGANRPIGIHDTVARPQVTIIAPATGYTVARCGAVARTVARTHSGFVRHLPKTLIQFALFSSVSRVARAIVNIVTPPLLVGANRTLVAHQPIAFIQVTIWTIVQCLAVAHLWPSARSVAETNARLVGLDAGALEHFALVARVTWEAAAVLWSNALSQC